MGILDDAIREHLELKRSHGVPEDELQRQEEEALGPARRDVAQQPEETDAAGDGAAAESPPEAAQEAALFDMEGATAVQAPEPEAAAPETSEPESPGPPVRDEPP